MSGTRKARMGIQGVGQAGCRVDEELEGKGLRKACVSDLSDVHVGSNESRAVSNCTRGEHTTY